jgi:hypothetical protein
MTGTTLHLPRPAALVRHALPALVESTVGPAVVFYGALALGGLRAALFFALAWSYLALARRIAHGERPSGMLVIAAVLLTGRTVLGLVTGSAFLYFLQPTLGTFLLALAFLASVRLGHPLAERLARDFFPLDPWLLARPRVRTFFLRVSLLWTAVFLANATVSLWLLFASSVPTYVLAKTLSSTLGVAAGAALSTLWFRRTLEGEGIVVRFAARLSEVPPAGKA